MCTASAKIGEIDTISEPQAETIGPDGAPSLICGLTLLIRELVDRRISQNHATSQARHCHPTLQSVECGRTMKWGVVEGREIGRRWMHRQ